MLQPKKTKFRKAQKGRMKGLSQRGHRLSDGMFGIKSLDSKFITSRQIEAARIAAKTVPIVIYDTGWAYTVIWIGIPYRYLNIAVRSSFGIILCENTNEGSFIYAIVK